MVPPVPSIVPLVRFASVNVLARSMVPPAVASIVPVLAQVVLGAPSVSVLEAPLAWSVPAFAITLVPPPPPRPMLPPLASMRPPDWFVITSVPLLPSVREPPVAVIVPVFRKVKPALPSP